MTYSSKASIIIHAPIDTVWDGLTNPAMVKQYFFGTNLITTWEVATSIFFRGEWNGQKYEDKGTVLEYVPGKTLSYNYYSPLSGMKDRQEFYQVIRYKVEKAGGGTQVTIEQSNSDTKERADDSAKNWKSVLLSLKELIEDQKNA